MILFLFFMALAAFCVWVFILSLQKIGRSRGLLSGLGSLIVMLLALLGVIIFLLLAFGVGVLSFLVGLFSL